MQLYCAILLSAFLSLCFNSLAMENTNMEIRSALESDKSQILQLINEHAIKDRNKIVILPEKFREATVQADLTRNRLYIAKNSNNDIIAFKKLFIIHEHDEFNDITNNEIRCDSGKLEKAYCYIESRSTKMIVMPAFSLLDSAVIYCGGDFTHPEHRGQKINSCLMKHALDSVQKTVTTDIHCNNKSKIVLLYGLTETNAGKHNGIDRTPSIMKAFSAFAQKIAFACGYKGSNFLYHGQYKSFMPTFDLKSEKCIPLPDDQSVPGFGNVLIYSFGKEVQ